MRSPQYCQAAISRDLHILTLKDYNEDKNPCSQLLASEALRKITLNQSKWFFHFGFDFIWYLRWRGRCKLLPDEAHDLGQLHHLLHRQVAVLPVLGEKIDKENFKCRHLAHTNPVGCSVNGKRIPAKAKVSLDRDTSSANFIIYNIYNKQMLYQQRQSMMILCTNSLSGC